MKNCSQLFYLSTLACQLAECLSKDELTLLSSDLVILSDMLAGILTRQSICEEKQDETQIEGSQTS